ncbi:hypothetical protein J7426_07360 [Tropicibacter sp. R16_0]|uniref:hypothetical protein n=1 Tax=Tropicibacter sp. R16_0 TaxID=2821102 RepID=UPI001ADAE5C1|nr:hypothetical protein [Tropicibacter sp. R16_0]MBO9450067.1 hypothetical protein [Tropicibacter sp. R16_0]
MNSLKTSLATAIGILLAVILVPVVAIFGTLMLGFMFGLSLVAVATAAAISGRSKWAKA